MTRAGRYWTSSLTAYGYPPVAQHPDIACTPEDNLAFFPEGQRSADATRKAKRICGRCNHRIECAAWALRVREPEGVWGGMDADERRAVIRAIERRAAAKNHTTPERPRKVKG